MIPASAIIVGIALFITCIVIFVCLTVIAHKRYQDRNFLIGICLSSVLFFAFLFIPFVFLFTIPIVLSLIFGIFGGLLNTNIKRGALSGALGNLLGWILFSLIY
ncbi:MAG: hypothetical protein ACFE75_11035 [Candidatus Hodarchaeota archaeon]